MITYHFISFIRQHYPIHFVDTTLFLPFQCTDLTHGQWWSKRSTQLLQIEQWEHLGGRYSIHVCQYLTLTETPLTRTSLVSGKPVEPCWPPGQSGDSPMSSGSGGWAFRGTIPGSRPDVRSRTRRIWKTRTVCQSSCQPITKLQTLQSFYSNTRFKKTLNAERTLADGLEF